MRTESPTLDATDRAIINAMQGDFPLDDQPYLAVANRLGLSETEILTRLQGMLDRRVLTRFGPMFQVERMGGAFVLAAMTVPESHYEEVVAQVNVIARIEVATKLPVFAFPKEREYFVEMKLHA